MLKDPFQNILYNLVGTLSLAALVATSEPGRERTVGKICKNKHNKKKLALYEADELEILKGSI